MDMAAKMDEQIEGATCENERLLAENVRLRRALEMALRQNEHDMLMTGEELRACRDALNPNEPPAGEGEG